MGAVGAAASRPAALVLAPLLRWQARRLRERTPLLPEAAGDRAGRERSPGAGRATRLLVVGESTAAGVGVASTADELPRLLAVRLAERRGGPVDWAVSARTGATASYALRRLLLPVGSPGHDLAVLVLGVNDALRLTPRRRWRARVGGLVDALEQDLRPGGRVVLAGVPDLRRFRTFPQPLRAVLGWHGRGLDRDLRRLAAARPHAVHVAMPDVSWPAMFAEDRFHPNAEAYAAWAAHLAEALYPR